MTQTTGPTTPGAPDPFVAGAKVSSGAITPSELVAGLAVGTNLLVGRYHVDLDAGRWWWSDEIMTMHGYEPGQMEPSLDLLRKHQHADERERIVKEVLIALRTGRPFACSHRIVDAHGRNRCLLVTGQARRTSTLQPQQLAGYVVDVTPVRREAVDQQVRRAIDAAYVSAAAIERAKGVLMAVHGIGENAAEEMLVRQSGATGAGLQHTADQVVAALAVGPGFGDDAAAQVDAALAGVVPQKRPRMRDAQLARRRAS